MAVSDVRSKQGPADADKGLVERAAETAGDAVKAGIDLTRSVASTGMDATTEIVRTGAEATRSVARTAAKVGQRSGPQGHGQEGGTQAIRHGWNEARGEEDDQEVDQEVDQEDDQEGDEESGGRRRSGQSEAQATGATRKATKRATGATKRATKKATGRRAGLEEGNGRDEAGGEGGNGRDEEVHEEGNKGNKEGHRSCHSRERPPSEPPRSGSSPPLVQLPAEPSGCGDGQLARGARLDGPQRARSWHHAAPGACLHDRHRRLPGGVGGGAQKPTSVARTRSGVTPPLSGPSSRRPKRRPPAVERAGSAAPHLVSSSRTSRWRAASTPRR